MSNPTETKPNETNAESIELTLKRSQIANSILSRDVSALMTRGLDIEIELELRGQQIEALTKERDELKAEVEKLKAKPVKRKPS